MTQEEFFDCPEKNDEIKNNIIEKKYFCLWIHLKNISPYILYKKEMQEQSIK
jgi:hypothetical protein